MGPNFQFIYTNIVFVYFIYGLAFFVMGVAIAFEYRKSSNLHLADSISFLAAFGLLHSITEWSDMFALIFNSQMAVNQVFFVKTLKLVALGISAVYLGQFGAKLLVSTWQRAFWIKWIPTALFATWILFVATFQYFYPSINWQIFGEISARYIVYFPSSLLAALALLLQRRTFLDMKLPNLASASRWAALAFLANGFLAGLIVPAADFFPASIFNYASFLLELGIPVQVFRALAALTIALFTVRILRVFEVERFRQLQLADQQRMQAQIEALEAERRAQEEIRALNRDLQRRVEERTRELSLLNQELSTLYSIVTSVNQSLDLSAILNEALDRVFELANAQGGAIHLLDNNDGSLVLVAVRDLPAPFTGQTSDAGADVSPFRTAILSRQPMVIVNTATDKTFENLRSQTEPYRSVVCLPLTSKDKVLGCMTVAWLETGGPSEDHLRLLSLIAKEIGVAIDNACLFEEAQRNEREAQALNKIGMEISSLLDLDKILDSVVEKARHLLDAEATALSLANDKWQQPYVKAASGVSATEFDRIRAELTRSGAGSEERALEPAKTSNSKSGATGLMDNRCVVAVPLTIGEKELGSLYAANAGEKAFSQRDISLLSRLANQAAIAIENARLYERVQNLAAIEERDHIAREVHDGLAQSLGYVNLKSRAALDLMKSHQYAEAAAEIVEIRRVVRDAYSEVRELIADLRTEISPSKGLVPALKEYLAAFEQYIPIATELVVDEAWDLNVSPSAEIQLIRIIQEALGNVRKHAQATRVTVKLALEGNYAIASVADNGQGANLSNLTPQNRLHFGLRIMGERARSLKGSFDIQSQPGKGTTVTVRFPVQRNESRKEVTQNE